MRPATNIEMLADFLTPHLSTMSSEAVQVVEKIEEKVRGRKKKASGGMSDAEDPINNEGGLTQMELEAMLCAEKEYETKRVRFHGPAKSFLESNTRAAIGLQETKKGRTESASVNAKKNVEEVKMPHEALIQEAMETGVGLHWGEPDETLRTKVTKVVQERFRPY